ncbi:ArsR/SmtB family transcription factor [Myceligenerans crystallogenes]|uniref:Winged helix-turn-helix domain-containing protein n=1 Tax=Myceligenerans crystallogenes TaxID=316335 RepID=A0ABN2NK17_9MICO
MLRIHLSPEDLGRVRLAAAPDPLVEMRLSAQIINGADVPRHLRRWRAETLRTMPREALPYLHLVPPEGYCPEFLTPANGSVGLETGLKTVVLTPPRRIGAELARLDVRKHASGWTRDLGEGSNQALAVLRASMSAYFAHAVAPEWDLVRRTVTGDLARRNRALSDQGAAHLLTTLHPGSGWVAPTLAIPQGDDADMHLTGAGLRIAPSYFGTPAPVVTGNSSGPLTVVVPAAPDRAPTGTGTCGDALSTLVGRTRATVLRELATAALTTTALAKRLSIATASVSEHVSALRGAGLVDSRRDGRQVIHEITALGYEMLSTAGPR